MIKSSTDVSQVLKDDSVDSIDIINFENSSNVNIEELINKFGKNKSWAVRVTFNNRFGGVAIQQLPGEGNRLHQHPNAAECWVILAAECWVILKGKWKWFIEGKGDMEIKEGSIVNVPAKTFHQIKCIGDEPGIRFAITAPDVEHVYK